MCTCACSNWKEANARNAVRQAARQGGSEQYTTQGKLLVREFQMIGQRPAANQGISDCGGISAQSTD
eukprot:5710316-Pleurochrysis_carterae.AAC.2